MKLGLLYWKDKWTAPTELDLKSIADCYIGDSMTEEERLAFTVLLLQGTVRFPDTPEGSAQMDLLVTATGKYELNFSCEELSYIENPWVMTLWRYSFKEFVKVIPIGYAKKAVTVIYKRLGIELNDAEIMKVLNSDFIYSDFFDTLKITLGCNKYIMCPDPTKVSAFVFASYFNMYHIFGILGFNGYSPYVICRDIGIISVPANDWRYIAFPEGALEAIEELGFNARKLSYPTVQQNQFLAKLAKI